MASDIVQTSVLQQIRLSLLEIQRLMVEVRNFEDASTILVACFAKLNAIEGLVDEQVISTVMDAVMKLLEICKEQGIPHTGSKLS